MLKKVKNSEKINALNGEYYIVDENNNIIQWFYNNGNLKYEQSFNENKELHNSNGPAFITYYKNGQKCCVEYHRNGELHNTEGPAVISYDRKANIIEEIYYLSNDFIASSIEESKTENLKRV
ncbi:MAG: hypothetical protein ACOC2W_04680 [bacterium]